MEHEYTGNEQQGHHKHWDWTNLEWNCLEQIRIKPMLMSKEKKLSFCEGEETGWQHKPWFQDCHLCRTSTCHHCWCHLPSQSHHSWWEPSLHAASLRLLLRRFTISSSTLSDFKLLAQTCSWRTASSSPWTACSNTGRTSCRSRHPQSKVCLLWNNWTISHVSLPYLAFSHIFGTLKLEYRYWALL